MKRILWSLIAGLVLVGATAPTAIADRTDKPEGNATVEQIEAFLEELEQLETTIALAEQAIRGPNWRDQECRFATSDGRPGWSTADVRRVISCAAGKWAVPGGAAQAIDVAACESGADLLDRSTDGYAGTFQQSTRYWPGRRVAFDPGGWEKALHPSVFNPRSNVIVSVRMAHADGAWAMSAGGDWADRCGYA